MGFTVFLLYKSSQFIKLGTGPKTNTFSNGYRSHNNFFRRKCTHLQINRAENKFLQNYENLLLPQELVQERIKTWTVFSF